MYIHPFVPAENHQRWVSQSIVRQKVRDDLVRAGGVVMEVDVVARAWVQGQLELGILVDGPGRLVEDAGAEAVAEDVVGVAGEVEGGAGELADVLRAGKQSEEFGDGEGLLGSLGEIHSDVVVVGPLEVVQDLRVSINPGQIPAVAVAIQGRFLQLGHPWRVRADQTVDVESRLVEADGCQDDRVGQLGRQRDGAVRCIRAEREAHQCHLARLTDLARVLSLSDEARQAL